MKITEKKRESNIELLRIFAMLMIIAHHIGVHSGFNLSADMPFINKLWIQFMQMGGKIGVNIFVLISGYFLVTAEAVKLEKVIKLWLQVVTYALAFFFLFVFLGKIPFSRAGIHNCFLPITKSTWWFASTYFVLFLLSPYINSGLKTMTRENYRKCLLLLFVCWCIIPTFTTSAFQSNTLLWFAFIYALAGYIRLHADVATIKPGKCVLAAVIMTLLNWTLAIHLDHLGKAAVFDARSSEYFFGMQNLPILLISVTLFLVFLSWNIRHSSFVNIVSSATFGVYLLHDYSQMRDVLWKTVFGNVRHTHSQLFIPYTLLQVILVFAACAAIELLRIYVVERAYIKCLKPLSEKIAAAGRKIFSAKIFNKM